MRRFKMVLDQMHLFFMFLFLHVLWLCKSQEVFFGLKDRKGADQAILFGETSVTITCNVSCVGRASIRLMFKNNVIEPTSSGGSFVDLTFSVTDMAEDPYKCLLNYTTLDSEEVFKEVYFYLPLISDTEIPFCRRSGIAFAPYQEGDILSLQCFCYLPQTGTCEWVQVTRGIDTPVKINSTSTNSTNGIVNFVNATIGPLTNADKVRVFICSPTNTGRTKICRIGPMSSSDSNKVFSPNVQSTECKQNSATTMLMLSSSIVYHTTQIKKTTLTSNSHLETDAPVQPNFFSFEVILLASILIFILVLSIIVLICFVVLVKRNIRRNIRNNKYKVKTSTRKVNQPDKEQEAGETTDTIDRAYDVPPLTYAKTISPSVRPKYDCSGVDTFKVVEDGSSFNRSSTYTEVEREKEETDFSYLYATVDKKRKN
ncbi:hypothetical protein HOLleu_27321 [Holothuria leucospilota]|uniref:Uncharacterized protein n=1 Tax=Holothuria leucospilota TaxID=206669 RepID=A0A9Q1BQ75_HOLLE|nr:hypothetical protein HOLleu_27321 [Holothuria leucospilota]